MDTSVVFLDSQTLAWPTLDTAVFDAVPQVQWTFFDQTSPQTCLVRCQTADVLITNKVPIRADLIRQLPKLRLIIAAATGVDHIDCEAAKSQGIAVCHAKNYSSQSVAQHVWSLILATNQHLLPYHTWVTQGQWANHPLFCGNLYDIPDLSDQTLGIIGYGDIGQRVAQLAQAFGMAVLIAERQGMDCRTGRVSLEECLSQSDVVSLHCPLVPETKHLINQATVAKMKPGSVLINAARGALVDIDALFEALTTKQLRGAAMDVWSEEPPQLSDDRLAHCPENLLITPHVAWANQKGRFNLVEQIINMVKSYQVDQLIQEV